MSGTTERKPGMRVDNGNRRDLDPQRVAQRMEGLPAHAPTDEQAMRRKRALAKQDKADRSAGRRGGDGTRVEKVSIKVSDNRKRQQSMRCRPGTFEWRYGRDKQDGLFHAGSHLAILWERSGMTIASSADFLRGTSSGYATGLSEGRVNAIDKLKGFREALGVANSANLIAYCVEGRTASDIAHGNGVEDREMATVLHHSLKQCAKHFGFMQ